MSYAKIKHIVLVMLLVATALGAQAQDNDKILNRPYVDNKRWHLGFSVGTHTQDFQFTHNGYVTENGESWYM